ncbi:MAG TPA: alpha/beta hydrolase [Polyangiaceae bacterium]|nr:alpha/beta hydrolase [Polyangiaceae bacterium]
MLLAAGSGFERLAAQRDAQRLKPQGRWLDVGGYRRHVHATGNGGPTVVLEAGASAYSGVWDWVQGEVAQHTRVLSYDRAGLGFSEAVDGVRDAATVARELKMLLVQSGEVGPYVLVGHSYGALFVSEFAELYPQDVAGLVLVDGTHPDQVERSRELRESMNLFRNVFHLAAHVADFGVMRFIGVFSAMAEGLPAERLEEAKSLYASGRHLESSARELDAWRESAAQARSARLGSFPKLFLSASGPDTPQVRDLTTLHRELANRHPGAEHRILPGTSHITMVTHRDQAKLVAGAILEIVAQVRARRD